MEVIRPQLPPITCNVLLLYQIPGESQELPIQAPPQPCPPPWARAACHPCPSPPFPFLDGRQGPPPGYLVGSESLALGSRSLRASRPFHAAAEGGCASASRHARAMPFGRVRDGWSRARACGPGTPGPRKGGPLPASEAWNWRNLRAPQRPQPTVGQVAAELQASGRARAGCREGIRRARLGRPWAWANGAKGRGPRGVPCPPQRMAVTGERRAVIQASLASPGGGGAPANQGPAGKGGVPGRPHLRWDGVGGAAAESLTPRSPLGWSQPRPRFLPFWCLNCHSRASDSCSHRTWQVGHPQG